jgi:transcriptional regulator with XRE-family HTH domain
MKAIRRRETMIILSQQLRHAMNVHGISQADLADRSKLAKKTIGNVLHGAHAARSDTVQALAGALGLKVSQLTDISARGETVDLRVPHLTADEALLLSSYRRSGPQARRALISLGEVLASRPGGRRKAKTINGTISETEGHAPLDDRPRTGIGEVDYRIQTLVQGPERLGK